MYVGGGDVIVVIMENQAGKVLAELVSVTTNTADNDGAANRPS